MTMMMLMPIQKVNDNMQKWVSKPSISPTFWSLNVISIFILNVIMMLCLE